MKVLICALGLWAAIAWTQGIDLTTIKPDPMATRCTTIAECIECCLVPDVIPEHEASGFGGYGFGSSMSYIRSELAADGHVIDEDENYAGWLWYKEGEIEGCDVAAGYEFNSHGQLASGMWRITNNQPCFAAIQDLLSRTYGSDLEMEINGSVVTVRMEIYHTRIVHRKTNDYHEVSFYDTLDRTGSL